MIAKLIQDLRTLESIAKNATFKTEVFDRDAHSHTTRYQQFLNEDLTINFEWQVNKEFCDLTRPEKIKLFEGIRIKELIPDKGCLIKDLDNIQAI